MKPLFFSALAITLLCFGGCKSSQEAAEPQAMEQVSETSVQEALIAEHIEAKGGNEALDSIESVKTTGQVDMPSMDMTLLMTIYQKDPGKLRLEVDIPQMGAQIVNGFDGETAWESSPMAGGASRIGGDRARAFKEQADIDGYLVGLDEAGYTVEYMGDEDVMGDVNHKFQVMRADSSEIFVYLDAATKLETKVEAEAPNPMTGVMTTVETFLSDYREVGGTMMPYQMKVVVGGEAFQTITVQDIRVNVPMNDDMFAFPE